MIQDSLKQWQSLYEQMWNTFATGYEFDPSKAWTWYAGANDQWLEFPDIQMRTNILDVYVDNLKRLQDLFWSPYAGLAGSSVEDMLEYQQHWWSWWLNLDPTEEHAQSSSARARVQKTVTKTAKPKAAQLAPVETKVAPLPAANDQVKPRSKDDLKLISGIGPGLEKKLNDRGIYSFDQIAALDKSAIEKLEADVVRFPGRIERDNWVAQAKRLLQS